MLPSDSALGHIVMTAGLGDEQFYWCNLCSAYTGERARKLTKQCDRIMRSVAVVKSLRDGVHPHKGTKLTVRPRRLLRADVGTRLDDIVGPTCMVEVSSSMEEQDMSGDAAAAVLESVDRPFLSFFDDDPGQDDCDPLGLGLELG